MSRKKNDADRLDAAADAPIAPADGADDATAAAAAGPKGGAAAGTTGEPETPIDAQPADAAPAGQMPVTHDPVADAIDAESDEPETEEAVTDGQEAGEGEGDGDDGAASGQRDPDQPDQEAEAGDDAGRIVVAIEFDPDSPTFAVRLDDGQIYCVRFDDVDFLKDADEDVRVEVELLLEDGVAWPYLDAMLTIDEIKQLAYAGSPTGDHASEDPQDTDDEEDGRFGLAATREPPRNLIDVNVLAAFAAASLAFGTTEEDSTTLPRMDVGWIGGGSPAATCAAAYLRRDSTPIVLPETLVIHLRRSGFPDTPAAEGRIAAAWKVFAFTLAELDALDRRTAQEKAMAEADAQAARGPAAQPRDRLANLPYDRNPLSETGRLNQRR